MKKNFIYQIVINVFVIIFLFPLLSASEIGGDYYWNTEKAFTRNSYEEDIKDVLKAIARSNNTSIIFGEGVEGKITMEFKRRPLKSIFEYILNRYGMDYYWEADAIYVYNPEQTSDILINLKKLRIDEVDEALRHFRLLKKGVKIISHKKTNTILISGKEKDIQKIKSIIDVMEESKLEHVGISPKIQYFQLKYAKVDDTQISVGKKTVSVNGIASILVEILNLTRVGEKKEFVYTLKDRRNVTDQVRINQQILSEANVGKMMIESEAGTIATDSRTNRIIIRDYPQKLEEYGAIIKDLDRPIEMVKIDVIIMEATKDFERELGINYAGGRVENNKNSGFAGTSGTALNIYKELYNEQTGGTANKDTLLPGLNASGGLAGTFLYRSDFDRIAINISAIEEKGKGKILHKSTILTMDNMRAILEQKKVVTYKLTTAGDNATVEAKEIEAGIILEITPHIIREFIQKTKIELIVEAERSSLGDAVGIDLLPGKSVARLNTQAVVNEGDTIVLGGLFENSFKIEEGGVPCLMSLPILGYLFKTSKTSNPTSNTLFFLRPQIIPFSVNSQEGTNLNNKIKSLEMELRMIDSAERKQLIEKSQEIIKDLP